MAITITSSSDVTLTGGTAGAPLDPLHLVTLANWPAGTTQATVDSYIVRAPGAYLFTIKAGKRVQVAGFLNIDDATFIFEQANFGLVAVSGGTISGGELVAGQVFKRPTFIAPVGFFGSAVPGGSGLGDSFLIGSGKLNIIGLRLMNLGQQPGATSGHTGINFWAGAGGSFNLPHLDIHSAGNVPTYMSLAAADAGSAISLREARLGAIRHISTNVALSFIPQSAGGGGWIGGDNGTGKNKLLVPQGGPIVYAGFSPIFRGASDFLNLTNWAFGSPNVIFLDSAIDVTRVGMYPPAAENSVQIRRTLTLNPIAPDGSSLTGVQARIATGATEKYNAQISTGASTVVTVWTGTGATNGGLGDGVYLVPATVTDHRNITVTYRETQRFEGIATTSGEYGAGVLTAALAPDSFSSKTAAQAAAITGVSTTTGGAVTVPSANTIDDVYNWWKWWTSQAAQMTVAQNQVTSVGGVLTSPTFAATGQITVGSSAKTIKSTTAIGPGVSLSSITFDGNVSQALPSNISGVTVTGVLSYNTNSAASITYTNCTIGTVQNNGTGLVTIAQAGSSVTTYTDPEINYLDSTLTASGVSSATVYSTAANRDTNTSPGATITSSLNFKFGSTVNGVVMSGMVYLRVVVSGVTVMAEIALIKGANTIDLGVQGQLTSLNALVTARPTLTQIEASTVLAQQATSLLIKAKTDGIADSAAIASSVLSAVERTGGLLDALPTLGEMESNPYISGVSPNFLGTLTIEYRLRATGVLWNGLTDPDDPDNTVETRLVGRLSPIRRYAGRVLILSVDRMLPDGIIQTPTSGCSVRSGGEILVGQGENTPNFVWSGASMPFSARLMEEPNFVIGSASIVINPYSREALNRWLSSQSGASPLKLSQIENSTVLAKKPHIDAVYEGLKLVAQKIPPEGTIP